MSTPDTLDQKVFNSAGPTLLLRFFTQAIQLLVGILMVRILNPEDYGTFGIIMIFWLVGSTCVHGGFSSALQQKKEVNSLDLSSVFYYNLFLSFVGCFVIILSSGWFADFFNLPKLKNMLIVIAWTLPISALGVIQNNILTRRLQQHVCNLCELISYLLGVPVAIYLGSHGYGAWALVWQMFTSSTFITITLFIAVHWIPKLEFSFAVLKSMFRFGSFLLIANIFDYLFSNIYNIIIAKIYPITQLGYFDRAKQYSGIWPQSIQWTGCSLLLPAFSQIQDERDRIKHAFSASIQALTFILVFPSVLLATLIFPFTELILTPKWLPIIPFFRIITISNVIIAINFIIYQLFSSRGKSGLYLILQIVEKTLIIISVLCTVWFGIIYMVISMPIVSAMSLCINMVFIKREIGYSLWGLVRDNVQYFIYSLIACAGAYGLSQWLYPINKWSSLIVPGIVGCLIYAGLNWYFHSFAFDTVWRMGWNQINGWLGRDKKSDEKPDETKEL